MKFSISKVSDWVAYGRLKENAIVEIQDITTIEELEMLSKKHKERLIIDFERKEIVIYDEHLS